MYKKILLLSLILLFSFKTGFANPVSIEKARQTGENYLKIESSACSISEIRNLESSEGETLAYVLLLNPKGFVVISPDTDIRPIIAYSFQSDFSFEEDPNNVLLHLLREDMQDRIKNISGLSPEIKEENNSLWEDYLNQGEKFLQVFLNGQQWGPYLTTQWNQYSPYNKFCPMDPNTGTRSATGCSNTALAQIINYWQYPSSVSFNSNDRYSYGVGSQTVNIDNDHTTLDFPSFEELNQMLANLLYSGGEDEIGALMFACGIGSKSIYTSGGTGTDPELAKNALKNKFQYRSAGYHVGSGGELDPAFREELQSNMKNGLPAYLGLFSLGQYLWQGRGHSVVADGFKDSGEYHINIGGGGTGDAWYFVSDSSINDAILSIDPGFILPFQPTNVSPSSGSEVSSTTPTLKGSSFSAPEPTTTHEASQWRIGNLGILDNTITYIIFFDSGRDTVNKTSISVPNGTLNEGGSYGWRVRYQDNQGLWSAWSDETRFSISGDDEGSSGGGKPGCFIATACYGTPMADEVKVLSRFRDERLLTNPAGKIFVNIYYKFSPAVADFIREHPVLKKMVRSALKPVIWMSGKTHNHI